MTMIEMHVGAVALDQMTGEPIVVLNDGEKKRALPIWIGVPEARAIAMAVNNLRMARPLTHELLFQAVCSMGYEVRQVNIDGIDGGTFTAKIILSSEDGGDEITLDSRPSDAIALASMAKLPVMVAEALLQKASIQSPRSQKREKAEEAKKFKEFVSGLKASDFNGLLPNNDEGAGDGDAA